ncbi:MBL fold metallo-hydrolase [Actinokineospora auranticolor]|uniref:Metallo-beta-lactamase superfamily protein n=1 Tax=Actinokineospora auranticolor TaxID=155976 RepID=A0A2S6H1W8_9PSEU|nr:MBL fold metallo-hydrolase [Actinokineospora auranticolor]PPK71454.1 metallo-beta-lactamase superfamily protein [Actinokineospora auranticolor]
MRAWHGATVYAGDADVVRGTAAPGIPRLADWEVEIFAQVIPHVPPAPVCAVDVELTGGEVLDFGDRARVIAVPGHTEGSVAVFLPEHGVLFTGDTIAQSQDEVILGVFNVDPERAARSLRTQADLEPAVLCFGHGPPVTEHAARRLRDLVERME